MFKVFNRKKKQVDLLENPISPVIVNELGGIGELTFSVPSTYKHLELEGYIQVENDHEYVIKEIVTHGTNRDVVCMLNIEEVLGMAWSKFISRDNTLMKCAELVLSGTGWRAINQSTCNVKRNLYGTVTNSYNLLQMMCTVYNVEFIFDTYNKTVTFVDKVGRDAGVYFINDINLKQLNVDTHTHKYITRVIPIGKNGLTIESVNDGKNYLENKTYSNKNIYGIWQSDKHDDPSALKADAKRFLDEMAIPYETYEVVVDDLYALKGYDEFKYGLGDIVTIIDGDTETRIQQRIIQRIYNLLEPDKDTIHIANKDATFEDYYKRLQTIADMTQSVIGSDGSINGGSISDGTISGDKIENDSINSDHISSGSITSTHIKAEQILADHIMSNQITTNHLVAESITSDHIQANSIDTKHLKSDIIQAEHIQANTIGANHIQANSITAGSGIIADGAIGNAQISKIDAGKIEAGTIDTSKVTIQGSNGHLRLKGNRMQVFQGTGNQAKERVSVGDVNGDGTVYGLRVRGADGQTVLLDEHGVTSEGITDGSITNDKINEDANIDGAKLNINSVINKINTDGTEVIQGTKIEVNGTNLGVKLSEITNKQTSDGERITQAQSQITANQNAIKLKVDEQVYTSDKKDMTSKLEKNTSEISTMKGQIALKVEQTDIENAKDELTGIMDSKVSSAKSELKVTTDKISQTVSNLSQTVSTKADNSVVTSMSNKVATIETNLSGITSRVSNVENTTTTINGNITNLQNRVNTAEQKITDSAIVSTVTSSQTYKNGLNGKVSTNQVVSSINQSAEAIKISANKLDLTGELDLQGRFKCWKSNTDKTGNYLHMDGAMLFGYNQTGGNKPVFASGLWTDENMGYFSVGYTRADISDTNGCLWISPTTGNDGCRLTYSKAVGSEVKTTNLYFRKNGTVEFATSMAGMNDTDNSYTYLFDSGVSTKSLKCYNLRPRNIIPLANGTYDLGRAGARFKDTYTDTVSTTNHSLVLGTVTDSGAWQTYGGMAINSSTGYVFPHLGNGNLSLGSYSNRFHTLYSINAVNVSSDKRLKTDIHYLDEPMEEVQVINGDMPRVSKNMNITTQDMYDFVKNDLKLASYRYKANIERGDTSVDYNFIAQDILYTKVGSEIVQLEDKEDLDSLLSYNQGNYISVVVGALQKEIELRDKQIANLEERLSKLEAKLK